jgi:cyclophilin family peptidyl-prolyl cis-trans isomerase
MKLKFLLLSLLSLSLLTEASAQKKTVKTAAKKVTVTRTVKKPVTKKVIRPVAKVPIVSKERMVEITTDFGVMVAKLYDSTPLHRDNFVKLVEQQFYDSLLFHRVIQNFMIQGGDPTSKYATDSMMVGSGSAPGERIPAEFKPYLFHKKGALAAARDNNPAKASSNCQFYIVHGRKYPTQELESVFTQRVAPNNSAFRYTAAQKEIYIRIGGVPHLDQNYTVFGEVISGLDVIDKIAAVEKGPADRPVKNIRMKIKLLN